MSQSYTNVKRRKVGGQARRPRILKPLIAVSLIMLGLAVYTILRSNAGPDVQEEQEPQADEYGSLSELVDPDRFRQAYLDANGGLERIQNLQTMRINGVLKQKDGELKVFILKRRPDMALITYRQRQAEVTQGHAEGHFWVRSSTPGNAPVVREMSEDERKSMRNSLDMFGPILSIYLTQKGVIENIQVSDYKETKLLQVDVVTAPGNSAKKIYVDPETMTIVAEYSTGSNGQDSLTEFFDYRDISGTKIPHRIVSSGDGSEESTFLVESVSFNIGASSSLFRAHDLD